MIKLIIIFLFFLISSCNYPDIDTVPKFKDMNVTLEESIELCKINKSDNSEKEKCYEEINQISKRL